MSKKFIQIALCLLVPAVVMGQDDTGGAAAVKPGSQKILQTPALGQGVEKQLPPDADFTPWKIDETTLPPVVQEHLEDQDVQVKDVRTIKVKDLLPPIHFASGKADITPEYVEKVRRILEGMKDRRNVRLHLVGHTDNVQLFGETRIRYVDNDGLSRERAGVAAEFFQQALKLPPESVTYEGRGERDPVASNASEAGRALNRRLDVEVWYDEVDEKTVTKTTVVQDEIKRVKVCRVEQMCRMTYLEGHAHRTRLRNVVPAFHDQDGPVVVPPEYRQKLLQVLQDLGDKRNVVVKFIGYSEDAPLAGRDERIYGDQVGLSKARARRVALAMQEALKLPSSAIESDGKGPASPVDANDSENGRASNHRIEVEFWYDDALKELSPEPQMCPEPPKPETVTRVYQSPNTVIAPVVYADGKATLPPHYAADLASVMAEIADRKHVRIRFVGTTANERLDRRTALAYGDDIGLSTARARTLKETVSDELKLRPDQAEFEGHGYVQTDDVVANGFTESDVSRVQAQVVYDDQVDVDPLEGVDVKRFTRDVAVANPYGLNLMRISVDGKPLDDPGKSLPDVQRCTDVALEQASIQFKYDNLDVKPRLNVTAWPLSIRWQDDPATDAIDDRVQFKAYSNFTAFIAKAEVRLFDRSQSLQDAPLAVVPLDKDGVGEWRAKFTSYTAPGRDLKYVLRVYDRDGHFDQTAPQTLWVVDKLPADATTKDAAHELDAGWGESRLAVADIPLHGGTIKVTGADVPPGHRVAVAGWDVPVSDDRRFVTEQILPQGLHTVEVSMLDADGNGQMFLRDLSLEKTDWFYVAIADVTAAKNNTSGPARLVAPDDTHYSHGSELDGRFAFFARGKFGDQWKLTASADTLEGSFGSLFSNFLDKNPDAMFRRIDPDYYYPTYGDDSTTEEAAPTLGKFYVKLQHDANYGLWGNFRIGYVDNDLARVDRTLYGANLHYEPGATTPAGDKRFVLDGFAAQPGTIAGRDEFRGTGGSLYYLRHQDILTGSDHVRIEYRDRASGLVVATRELVPVQDYTVDALQGRVLLSAPLSPLASNGLLVNSDLGAGNEAWLVVQYEYSSGFEQLDNLSTGGHVQYWLGDHLRLGATVDKSTDPGAESTLGAVDILWRQTPNTWLKLEKGTSTGTGTGAWGSSDGGFSFAPTTATNDPQATIPAPGDGRHGATRVDGSLDLKDVHPAANGLVTFYHQSVDGGYVGPGVMSPTDVSQYGASVKTSITDRIDLRAKLDKRSQDFSLDTSALEVDADYKLDDHWKLSSGVRQDSRTDHSPVVPVTQVQGDRTDVVVRAGYDSQARWAAYGYVQDTASSSGNRESNGRVGAGGAYRLNDRFRMNGEVSAGDTGPGAQLGSEYLFSDKTTTYLNYALENERTDNGVMANKGTMSFGTRSKLTGTTSVFGEERYTHGDVPEGLLHSAGIDYKPDERWNFSTHVDLGTLRDNLTGAKMQRSGFAVSGGYGYDTVKVASLLEYRHDQVQSPVDLTYSTLRSFLTKNSLKYQVTPDWRVIAKLDFSKSDSTLGDVYGGGFTEAVLGYAYRPVANDRLNALFKYTWFYNMPASGQELVPGTMASYIQKSHIVSVDAIYDLTPRWSVGAKLARRMGQASADRVDPVFFDSTADLAIARADWHVQREWDLSMEARMLRVLQAKDSRRGALMALYRHVNDNVKLGAGWNFTDFSDDLTDLGYTHRGVFINAVAKF